MEIIEATEQEIDFPLSCVNCNHPLMFLLSITKTPQKNILNLQCQKCGMKDRYYLGYNLIQNIEFSNNSAKTNDKQNSNIPKQK